MNMVSCIMPTANRRAFVPMAIRYFQRQDYADKELVILDDGAESVADLIPDDPQVRYIRLGGKRTLGAKRNECVEAGRGDLIMHWDDDDWMASHRIRYQVEALLQHKAEVCGLQEMLYYELANGRAWLYRYPPNQRPWLAGNSLLYTRDFWRRAPFPNVQVASDTRFIFNHHMQRAVTLPDHRFYVAMIHRGNTSAKARRGAYWSRWPGDLQNVMANDWDFYRLAQASESPDEPRTGVTSAPREKEAVKMADIAVVVTCHEPYLKWLPQTLASISRQTPLPAERWVVFDRCQAPSGLEPGWRALEGNWTHPAQVRNAGFTASTAGWLIFWDADNVMPEGYIMAVQNAINTAANDVGIAYPDIQYCDENLKPVRLWKTPAWDYWGMRAENYVDTASAWRREALELVGGWSTRAGESLEDYVLALDVTAAGWKAVKANAPAILKRVLSEGRAQRRLIGGGRITDIWKARSLAIVSLLAGREETFQRWVNFLLHAELPPKTSLYVIDNSGRSEFTLKAFEACRQIASSRRLAHLHFAASGEPYAPAASEPRRKKERHLHVAQLYAAILPRLCEELILTLEDDVEPPLDAVRKLGEEFGWASRNNIGAVAAAYPMANNHGCACAGDGSEAWGAAIRWNQLPEKLMEVGCVGGGCTIWANWALHGHPVNFWWQRGLGWDAALCIQMKRRGYRIKLHGGVRCQHHAQNHASGKASMEIAKPANPTLGESKIMPIHQNADSWIPPAELGAHMPPYRPTFDFASYINETHRSFATCSLKSGTLIDIGIPGWLRREDALKLYELAYFAGGDILELGCHQGLSTSILAQAIKDSGNGKALLSIDKEAQALANAERNLAARKLSPHAKFMCGEAAAACRKLIDENRRFGFAFIDHSHQFQDTVAICRLLPDLLMEGGFCLFHDFNDGRNNDPDNIEYKVATAVYSSLNTGVFEFYGAFGCTALYRKRLP